MVKITWVGWPGYIPKNEIEEMEIQEYLEKNFNCIPVFFSEKTIEKYIYFHEIVLRPLFHNFKALNDFEHNIGN